jgi:ornithine carbamoyltransferase
MHDSQSTKERRHNMLRPYQVNADLMAHAKAEALFMHCLPAHRGQEISEDLLEDPRAVVWDEAGNRLHSQKALLEFLMLG